MHKVSRVDPANIPKSKVVKKAGYPQHLTLPKGTAYIIVDSEFAYELHVPTVMFDTQTGQASWEITWVDSNEDLNLITQSIASMEDVTIYD